MKRTMRQPGKATTVSRRARVSGPVFKARDVAALIGRLERTVGAATEVNRSLKSALWEEKERATAKREVRARERQQVTDRAAVEKALRASAGHLGRAAGVLGVSRGTLYSMIHAAGIRLPEGGCRGKVEAAGANPVQITTWVSVELKADVKARAASEGVTAADYVRRALEASLGTAHRLLTQAEGQTAKR